jgi:hypothetical protein
VAPNNVPTGRPEGNLIPSKIGEYRKKLLKGKRHHFAFTALIWRRNRQIVAIVTCGRKVAPNWPPYNL